MSVLILFCFIFPSSYLSLVCFQVFKNDEVQVQRDAIARIIFSESPVLFSDGRTPIGVFFEDVHRQYIKYRDIPDMFVKALLAAEDKKFFRHHGFDVVAIGRAMITNLKTGRIVQGGSTLTQQTAKNIFKRQRRTYTAKLKELFQAILLEREYSKEEILEMYANQFFVTGFGKGLRIAAEYFFDKDARDLDLVESAFIAGSVKGPNRYNPFTKKTAEGKKRALSRANRRKDYVLSNMLRSNFITQEQYKHAKAREVPFQEGVVTYRLNVILDHIREQLESDYFRTILQDQGIENIATSGITVHTSIDKEIQEGILASIRETLPVLDVKLSGYNGPSIQERYKKMIDGGYPADSQLPYFAEIIDVNTDKKDPHLVVKLDDSTETIHYEGLQSMGEAWLKWKLGNWAVFDKRHIRSFLKEFHVGDLIPIRFIEAAATNSQSTAIITQIPELEGGIIVLKDGMVRAMAGGYFNRFFNRSIDARRQLGSIFKPIVYTAALQLKWNSLDPLFNMRDVFKFETTRYVPKPDHTPKSDKVSMAWAGVKSENLATVWLLYHLTDRLNLSEFRQVVKLLDLDRKEDETYRHYVRRIRDKHGIIVNKNALTEAAFEAAKKDVEADLIFLGHEAAMDNLKRLRYSMNASRFALKKREKIQLNRLSYQSLRALNRAMKGEYRMAMELIQQEKEAAGGAIPKILRHFYVEIRGDATTAIIYTHHPEWTNIPGLRPLSPQWLEKPKQIQTDDILIDGLVPSAIVDMMQQQTLEHHAQLLEYKRYDMEVLATVRDFRTLVNLLYVTKLAKQMGVSTKLDPVLSFPLGSNAISIAEAALAYHTIMSGSYTRIDRNSISPMMPIINRIVDREGQSLWEYVPQREQVLDDKVSRSVTEILRMVMEKGTGRKAKQSLQLSLDIDGEEFAIPLPSFGKTGTANHFTNSSFVGFIPGPQRETNTLDINEGFVIASYVGYDDNRPMRGKNITIYGASGALPLWIGTVKTIINSQSYNESLQNIKLVSDGSEAFLLRDYEGFQAIPVSSITGLPIDTNKDAKSDEYPAIHSYTQAVEGIQQLDRIFAPCKGEKYEQQ